MVGIGKPIYGYVNPIVSMAFDRFLVRSVQKQHITSLYYTKDVYIDLARNKIVSDALKNKEKYLLFVDSDMILLEDTIEKLLKHDLPVVGGLYFLKDYPHTPVAYKGWENFKPIDYVDGLQQIDSIGMGCTLIKTDVFIQMRERFNDEWWFEKTRNLGEDIYFCYRCKELGIPIYVDCDIKCGHLKDNVIITQDHYRAIHKHV